LRNPGFSERANRIGFRGCIEFSSLPVALNVRPLSSKHVVFKGTVRFITTHGFWRYNALEAAWIKGFSASALFGGALIFKFGNRHRHPRLGWRTDGSCFLHPSAGESDRCRPGSGTTSSTTSVPRLRLCRRSPARGLRDERLCADDQGGVDPASRDTGDCGGRALPVINVANIRVLFANLRAADTGQRCETENMQLPVQITYRNMESSGAVTARIEEEAAKLDEFFPRITSCRVVVEAPHEHHKFGELFHIRIDIGVPGREIVVSHEPSPHASLSHEDEMAVKKHIDIHPEHNKDVYVAVRDAFGSARRQLKDYAMRLRGEVKTHERAKDIGTP
jgi:ribosome-associated translation inhibitor RaiA